VNDAVDRSEAFLSLRDNLTHVLDIARIGAVDGHLRA
jgi:hypothetical protein